MSTVHDDCIAARSELLKRLRRQMGSDAEHVLAALEKYLTEREKLAAKIAHGEAWGKLPDGEASPSTSTEKGFVYNRPT